MNSGNSSSNSLNNYVGTMDLQGQREVLRCSFCGLAYGEVARLFEGHSGYICDECVDVCVQLLQDYREMGVSPPKIEQPWYKKILGDSLSGANTCSFNNHDRNNQQGERLFPGIDARICDKCIRACEVLKASPTPGLANAGTANSGLANSGQ